ncbi:hypothetical protein N0V83_003592 [Neocucurbitaria cava]|uniref:Uncharacterized protein n=1 Tax=Neocucurbitaria cava TaxID=798079 RepID=A0A9W8YEB7_9PLEO|nr:hypothetical protein N0V83_003592 [Neocucurbitaria cava]
MESISRSLILRMLCDKDDDEDSTQGIYHCCFQKSEVVSASAGDKAGFSGEDANLGDVRAWLDSECAKELEKSCWQDEETEAVVVMTEVKSLGVDTSILNRIHEGRGPRDAAFEDLLAPLRLHSPAGPSSREETYDDMVEVLLAWNQHVTHAYDNTEGRELLIASLHERLKAVNKIHEMIKDRRASEMYDRIGHKGILEPSARHILQALHIYRPEIKRFKNQDPFDSLVMLWANTRPEIPDIKIDDEMRYLSFKVLVAEQGLAQRYADESFRREIKRKRDSARQRKDKPSYLRLQEEKEHFEKAAAKQALQSTHSKIFYARSELRKLGLQDLQALTLLQASQKLTTRTTFSRIPSWTVQPNCTNLYASCAQADFALDLILHHCLPALLTTTSTASTTISSLLAIHATALTRALKLTGHDLPSNVDAVTKRRIVEQRKSEGVRRRGL